MTLEIVKLVDPTPKKEVTSTNKENEVKMEEILN